jgi:deazaflavin-dependent oxidoreductase (nitroreductase family)
MDTNQVREAAAAEVGKHRRLMRSERNARILSGLMLPVFGLGPPPGYGVLTTSGRKTGKRRRKCVRVIRRGRYAYLVALRPPHIAVSRPDGVHAWVSNIRANPRVRLRLGDGSFEGIAREITDPIELQEARNTLCDNVYPNDLGECAIHLRGLPTRAKIQRLHRYWFDTGIPVAIDLTEILA